MQLVMKHPQETSAKLKLARTVPGGERRVARILISIEPRGTASRYLAVE